MEKTPFLATFVRLTLTGLVVVLASRVGYADPFTSGNVVVYRVGDGSGTLTDNGNPVFLDEYNVRGTSATLVQSIAMPTQASGAQMQLIATSNSSEGLIARSTDGQYILLTGYASDLGGNAALDTVDATTVPRTVGRVKYDGTIDTSTALTDMSSKNNIRSATSTDGIDIWVGGASGSSGGVHYTTLGATTSTQLFAAIPKGVRQAHIFGGQLYFDSNATGLLNVSTVGAGTPKMGGQMGTELPGLPDTAGNDGYVFIDFGDGNGFATLYVANDTVGQILKYSLVGNDWVANGTITAAGVRGLAGFAKQGIVTLYATGTTGTDGTLYTYSDPTGHNGAVSDTAVILTSALTNEAFRGVALAPVGNNQPPTPSATVPASPTPTPTATIPPTNTRPPTATPTVNLTPIACVGDCDHNGKISVDELVTGVNLALATLTLDHCPEFDCNHDEHVTVDCLVKAVQGAVNGCTDQ
ncbi:MAG TPA: hypothetical protein VMW17_15930 [Candidatus Binatia bacterium]|nr:hypothetical protein [Candidatus Binatia bacterium]